MFLVKSFNGSSFPAWDSWDPWNSWDPWQSTTCTSTTAHAHNLLDEDEEQESQENGLSLANAGLVLLVATTAGLAMSTSPVAMLVSQFYHAGKFYATHWS